jgi:hypothetical protein
MGGIRGARPGQTCDQSRALTVTVTVYLLTHLLVWQKVNGNMRQKVTKEIFAPAP